ARARTRSAARLPACAREVAPEYESDCACRLRVGLRAATLRRTAPPHGSRTPLPYREGRADASPSARGPIGPTRGDRATYPTPAWDGRRRRLDRRALAYAA